MPPNTRADILKSFYRVWPLNKLKGFRCYQIVVTWIFLLKSFIKSFISLVLLLLKRKICFWREILRSFFSKFALQVIENLDPVSLKILGHCKHPSSKIALAHAELNLFSGRSHFFCSSRGNCIYFFWFLFWFIL